MIGDLVKVHFGEPNETIGSDVHGQVAELYDNGRIEVAFNDEPSVLWNIEKERGDEILPIPLTPEILEKNGFVKEEFKESPYVDWYKLVYSAYPNKETELVEVNIVKENNEIVGIACAKMMHTNQRLFRIEKYREMNIYVHELQHALRLCGIDKEITL